MRDSIISYFTKTFKCAVVKAYQVVRYIFVLININNNEIVANIFAHSTADEFNVVVGVVHEIVAPRGGAHVSGKKYHMVWQAVEEGFNFGPKVDRSGTPFERICLYF